MCILCKAVIRNETAWPVHLNTKTHKENIALAKKTKLEADTSKVQTFKRPASPSPESSASKKIKGILKTTTQSAQVPSSLPSDFFDKPPKQANGTVQTTSVAAQKSENGKQLVQDKDSKDVEADEEKEKGKDANQAILPEGFFDDPILDAKASSLYINFVCSKILLK